MSQDNELRRLEQFVEKLLGRFSELRAEKTKLLQELQERELQIEDLRRDVSAKDIERSEISQRVNNLVEQIEEWELGLEENDAEVTGAEATEITEVDAEEDAFSADETLAEHRNEDEGRVQQNLFSIGNTHR